MERWGIQVEIKNKPQLDKNFIPLNKFNEAFLKTAHEPFAVAVERADKQIAAWHTFIHGTAAMAKADIYFLERMIKAVLWLKGGFRIYLAGNRSICAELAKIFAANGKRAFDYKFMSGVYEHEFEVVVCDKIPPEYSKSEALGRHLDGCRIGFDAGGSDRKVSAVIDGKPVYSEEVVWFPKITADPEYHFNEIVTAMKTAAAKMPRVDAIGISSAGVYINNRTMNASLFLKVSPSDFEKKVKDIYIRAAKEIGDVPVVVCNDGDVTALAGAMSLDADNILGIAMGTSEAVGFVDKDGKVTGWLNELAFMPLDANPEAEEDEWSGDIGVGCKYFSQDAVIKLAPQAGIELDPELSPAEKLKVVQGLMLADDERAAAIYRSIGTYLGHALAFYYDFYKFECVLLLGRVMSGKGGDIIMAEAKRVLADEYSDLAAVIKLTLPDEKFRRVGQSVAAASLPELK